MNQPHDKQDLLGRLTEALANQSVPEGPDLEVKQRLLERLPEASRIQSIPFWRGKTMRKYAGVAAVLLLALGFATYLQPSVGGGPGAAFAAMLEEIKEVRTATFTANAQLKGTHTVTSRSSLLAPNWMRQELMMDGNLVAVQILNQATGEMLTLEPESKKAVLIDTARIAVGQQQENIIDSFKKLPEDIAVYQGEERVDDVSAWKYVYDLSGMNYVVWLDSGTNMPVKITMADHVDSKHAKFYITMTDFDWGAEVDESLFTLDLPEGYELKEQSIDFGKGSEQDFVAMLRTYVRMNEGNFPDAWNALTPATISLLMVPDEGTKEEKTNYAIRKMASALGKDKVENLSDKQQEELSNEFQQVIVRGAVYSGELLESNDWHYQGKGVKLGEADRIVAWWSLKKDKAEEGADLDTAHVIYGDLRIETMPVAELPKTDAK